VTGADFAEARRIGCTIRQISRVETSEDGQVGAWVRPAMVTTSSPLAQVTANQNLVVTTGLAGGETGFFGFGAGAGPTSVAVLSDIIAVAERGHVPPPPRIVDATSPASVSDNLRARHYVRAAFSGAMPSETLAAALARYDITLDGEPRDIDVTGAKRAARTIAFTTAAADSAMVDAALHAIGESHAFAGSPFVLPVID
jgi:homoserine dehydrogenase